MPALHGLGFAHRAGIAIRLVGAIVLAANSVGGPAHAAPTLPDIGPAPDFDLVSQDGKRVALRDLQGSVVVVTFLFTTCADACPTLTRKLIAIQRGLPRSSHPPVRFVAVSVDPKNDTPKALAEYAHALGADLRSWTFLTGPAERIVEVGKGYGVVWRAGAAGRVDHSFLTSLVDSHGRMRVQYMGSRFDPKEFRADLIALLREGRTP